VSPAVLGEQSGECVAAAGGNGLVDDDYGDRLPPVLVRDPDHGDLGAICAGRRW
jgi:hypothetical protein